MPDLLQFVDAISAGPTVRLDLNDDATWAVNYEGTDMSPPPLRQAWASTLLTDGATLTAAAYDIRRVRLRLDLQTASLDAAYGQLQVLHRELSRPTNLLRWQPQGATLPVFFRTIRSLSNRVVEYPGSGLLRTVDVEIDAEPFVLGLRETVGPVTVSNDPAAANGQYFDITSVKGDAETPLYLAIPRATTLAQGGELTGKRKTLVAVRRRGTPSAAPRLLQAESMSLNPIPGVTDTSAVTPAGASGGVARRTSFTSTAGLQARLRADPFPAVSSPDIVGEYRAYVRVAAGDTTSTFTVGLRWGSPDWQVTGPLATVARNSTTWCWVDLGVVQMPPGQVAPDDGISGVAESVRGIRFDLLAARTAGAGSLDWDVLVFAPADDRLLLAEWPISADASVTEFVLNPVSEAGYARDVSGVRYPTEPVGLEGGFPLISPGVTNRITVMRDVGGWTSGTDDTLTSSASVSGWYYPRYLYARPATS